MANGELVKQIGDLLEYLYGQNRTNLEVPGFKETAGNIYNAIYYGLCDQKKDERLERIEAIVNGDKADVPSFCFYTSKVLLDYCSGQMLEYEKEPLSEIIDRYKQANSDLEKLVEYQNDARRLYHDKYRTSSNRFKGRGVVYTVITGGYDKIYEPLAEETKLDYVLLTDRPFDGYEGKWQVRVVDNPKGYSPKIFSRYLKMFPFEVLPDYDYSVYVDGCVEIRKEISSFVSCYAKESGLICFPHHSSRNIHDEARLIVDTGKATSEMLKPQLDSYISEGYTGENYIIEAGCLVRDHHDDRLKKVMADWWEEYNKYDHGRDQMSLGYSCWKNDYSFDICDLIVVDNPWLKVKEIH